MEWEKAYNRRDRNAVWMFLGQYGVHCLVALVEAIQCLGVVKYCESR